MNALDGCEVLDSSLSILMIDADLTPLHALTSIGGDLDLTAPGPQPAIDSLAGLERLESIGGVAILENLRIPTLAPLRSLRHVSELYLRDLHNLVNMDGLGQLDLADVFLEISGSPALSSLQPLVFPAHMNQRLLLRQDPSLVELGDISQLESLVDLELNDTGLATLDTLQSLRDVQILEILNNPLLEDVSALAQLHSTELFTFVQNPRVRQLPAFGALTSAGWIDIEQNDSLESAGSYPKLTQLAGDWSGKLEVRGNGALQVIDGFGNLEQADRIRIQANANLSRVDFPRLQAVSGAFVVTSNPVLAPDTASEFSALQTPVLKIVGNQSTPLLLDPCPWTNDSVCDAAPDDVLCAPGTDSLDCPIPL